MPWFQTFSGAPFDFANPDPAAVKAVDVARALGRIPRFYGHTRFPWSVADHSQLVFRLSGRFSHWNNPEADLARRELYFLLHDGAEAYVGDVAAPLKELLGAPYAALEYRAHLAVLAAFGLDPEEGATFASEIKWADRAALFAERVALLAPSQRLWEGEPPEDFEPYAEAAQILPPVGDTGEWFLSVLRDAAYRAGLHEAPAWR